MTYKDIDLEALNTWQTSGSRRYYKVECDSIKENTVQIFLYDYNLMEGCYVKDDFTLEGINKTWTKKLQEVRELARSQVKRLNWILDGKKPLN